MYGTDHSVLSVLSTFLSIISIYMLYRQLTNYRRLFPVRSWLHILRLSLVTCLLAGLLTDITQYGYLLLLDDGRMLTLLGNTMQNEEYRDAWKQMMPDADMEEFGQMIQSMSVRDIMIQLMMYNALLALPVSLLAALPVRSPQKPKEEINSES